MTFEEFTAELEKLSLDKEFEDKFCDMLEKIEKKIEKHKTGHFKFDDEAKAMVHELAEMIRKRPAAIPYTQHRMQSKRLYLEAVADKEPELIYLDMLVKVAEAPTRYHLAGTILTLIPIIDDKLSKGE